MRSLSSSNAKVLSRARHLAERLDCGLFSLCGVRYGWSSVVALVPIIGDTSDALLALFLLHICKGVDGGLPASVYLEMLGNIIVDCLIGLVPIIGDLADAMYKCNMRNVLLLEQHLQRKAGADQGV